MKKVIPVVISLLSLSNIILSQFNGYDMIIILLSISLFFNELVIEKLQQKLKEKKNDSKMG